MAKEYRISIDKVNITAIIALIPTACILGLPFIIAHGWASFKFSNLNLGGFFQGFLIVTTVFIGGAVLHELLHGSTWSIFTKKSWKAISFGIKWEYLAPYCHCDEPLKKWQFVLGAIMPFLILGLFPIIVSYYNGSFRWWFFGYFFTVAATGDLYTVWILRKVNKNLLILDHPEELGFIVEGEEP